MSYLRLYSWLHEVFGSERFTIDDFRAAFPSPDPAKVLYDLVTMGWAERPERGVYRLRPPDEMVRKTVEAQQEDVLPRAERPYAFSHETAVAIWTDGYYWTGFTKGCKPVHITVREEDGPYWNAFFRKHRAEYAWEGQPKTLFGQVYILHPMERLDMERKDGTPVVPRAEVVEFCRRARLAFQPALEYLEGQGR